MQVYEDAAAAGDEVLVITIGQKLSGTYQCAHLAAADVGLQVHIVDSEAASQAEALLVREAVRLRDEEGLTAEEIAAVLEQFKSGCASSPWWTASSICRRADGCPLPLPLWAARSASSRCWP